MTNTVNCIKCVNYQVSWDYGFPHCCKLWGIKSKAVPSKVVLESTGKPCGHFQPKNAGKSRP